MESSVELLVDARARLGECVLWCDVAEALFWTDIEGATLSRWTASDGSTRRWSMPDRVGSFALCTEPRLLLIGFASGVALFDLERGVSGPLIAVEPGEPTTRINDGRCDAQGRFVFGMFNRAEVPIGHFYRVDGGLAVERLPLPQVGVANSIAFSPDGSRMYFADSPTRCIHSVDYHADGRLGTPRLFVQLGADEGFPDGSAVDAESGLWNAHWDGSCVVRYDADGVETVRIPLPVSRPTCPAFGGSDLDRLFISSARIGLSDEALRTQANAGGIFTAVPGQRGQRERRFATTLRV
jgi:L-arabinonolactonase